MFWRFMFYLLKNIYKVVLVYLFIKGSSDINTFVNLGFMSFFVGYTTYEHLYRKTSNLLVVFIAANILGQYYFSLYYHQFLGDKKLLRRFSWLGFYKDGHFPTWDSDKDSIYFRFTPWPFEWLVLCKMTWLKTNNYMFKDKEEVKELEKDCSQMLRSKY